jgi:serine protease Do
MLFYLFIFLNLASSAHVVNVYCNRASEVNQRTPEAPLVFAYTGIIVSPNGYIVVSNTSVGESDRVVVELNNKAYLGLVIARDVFSDLAMVKIEAKNLQVVQYSTVPVKALDSVFLEGQFCGFKNSKGIAQVANPSVNSGSWSAVKSCNGNFCKNLACDFIQLNFSVNQGLDGVGVFDKEGKLVGMVTPVFEVLDLNGMIFAIPAKQVKKFADGIVGFGKMKRASLKATFENISDNLYSALGLKIAKHGCVVTSIEKDGALDKAGLKVSDIITKVCKLPVIDASSLEKAILNSNPGEVIDLEFYTKVDNKFIRKSVKVKLDEYVERGIFKSLFFDFDLQPIAADSEEGKALQKLNPDYKNCSRMNIFSVDSESLTGLESGDVLISAGKNPKVGSIAEFDQEILNALKNNENYIILVVVRKNKVISFALSLKDLKKMRKVNL